jgi:hypothetical protein
VGLKEDKGRGLDYTVVEGGRMWRGRDGGEDKRFVRGMML